MIDSRGLTLKCAHVTDVGSGLQYIYMLEMNYCLRGWGERERERC